MTSIRPLVEICIESVADAQSAAGVDRLELCSALAVGGLTPSRSTQSEVRKCTGLPIMTMIRPRPGGFCYTDAELAVMQRDIDGAIELGADGLVFGILTPEGTIDLPRSAQIIRQICSSARPLDIIFHRAFDFTPDPFEALEQLIDLAVKRVLTSGQAPTAPEGSALIRKLIERSAGRIQVLPGGGIRPENVRALIDHTQCTQVHSSMRASEANVIATSREGVQLLLAELAKV